MKKYSILFLFIIIPVLGFGQCFSSAGNPVGGSANMGTLDKKSLSFITFYRHFLSDRYFEGHNKSDFDLLKNANYNMLGSVLSYGLTQKFTVETEIGYFINRTKNYNIPIGYSLKGFGFTNAILSGKFNLLNNTAKRIEYSASVGFKIPFSKNNQIVDNVQLPFDLQSSTKSFGVLFQSYLIKEDSFTGLRFFLYNRFETNNKNNEGYKLGNVLTNSVFISKHRMKGSTSDFGWTYILQLRNEIRGRNFINDEMENSSGSVKFYVSPQINLSIVELWNMSIMIDVPVYQKYNNIQLADRFAFSIAFARNFEL
ncbi:hypothetical protein ACFLTI_08375 [Bacteroidota bacterium]